MKEPGVTNIKGECCSSFYSNRGNWDDACPNAGSTGWGKILYFSVKTLRPEIAKVLNSTEDASHLKSMSTFAIDEHLQERGLLPLLPRLGRMAANGDRTDTVPLRLISLPCH